tara:strand:- start:528 stop:752 length:225 start_codon:yes stop_codon:yes gene_type:complete
MERELEKQWLQDHWADVVKMYPGQYIALNENQMVCHGLTTEHIDAQIQMLNENLHLNITPVILFVDPQQPIPQL